MTYFLLKNHQFILTVLCIIHHRRLYQIYVCGDKLVDFCYLENEISPSHLLTN